MVEKLGRNAPCHCGSGKKYKKCCLANDEADVRASPAPQPAQGEDGVARALSWLIEHYRDATADAIERDYHGGLSEDARRAINDLPDELLEMHEINVCEWLLAEGTLDAGGARATPVRFVDLVLSDEGPLLDVRDRDYLRELGTTPLRLYEIVDVRRDEGLWLKDVFHRDGDRFFVAERSASQTLRSGDAIGARVLQGEPATLSGAIYPFEPERFLALRQAILTGPRGGRRRNPDTRLVSRAIIQHWLARLTAPPPRIVDASTGEPLLLTNIHYRVRDRARLEAALEAHPLAERGEEGAWTVFESPPVDDEFRRIVWTAGWRPGKQDDRLEIFARTTGRADEAEAWLAQHAGDALDKIAREISDPTHFMKGTSRDGPVELPSSPLDAMSPDEATEFNQKLHEQIYRNWHNEPVPALGNETPRQAMRSKSGRRDVIQLLKSYEAQEERRARAENRPPIEYGFLWDKLGLPRD